MKQAFFVMIISAIVFAQNQDTNTINCDSSRTIGIKDATLYHSTTSTILKSTLWCTFLPLWGIPISYSLASHLTPIPPQPPKDTTVNFKCYSNAYSDKAKEMNKDASIKGARIGLLVFTLLGVAWGISEMSQ
jgi:hypothetical protein